MVCNYLATPPPPNFSTKFRPLFSPIYIPFKPSFIFTTRYLEPFELFSVRLLFFVRLYRCFFISQIFRLILYIYIFFFFRVKEIKLWPFYYIILIQVFFFFFLIVYSKSKKIIHSFSVTCQKRIFFFKYNSEIYYTTNISKNCFVYLMLVL